MKAYSTFVDTPIEGCLLVWAENANGARYIASLSLWDWDYIEISARRVPTYDQYYAQVRLEEGKPVAVEDNDDLPEGAPPFYTDEEL